MQKGANKYENIDIQEKVREVFKTEKLINMWNGMVERHGLDAVIEKFEEHLEKETTDD